MTTFLAPFCFHVVKTASISQINEQCYSKCSTSSQKLPEIHDCRLRLVVTRRRSSQALTAVPGCPSTADLFTKQNGVIVTSLLRWYSVSWYSVVFSICKQDFDRQKYTAGQRRVHLEITSFETKLVPSVCIFNFLLPLVVKKMFIFACNNKTL